jgi:hypothetical protein
MSVLGGIAVSDQYDLTGSEQRRLLVACLDVLSSVSRANLAKRGDSLPATRVNPFALRRLADAVEEIIPGAIEVARGARR